jgi:hypothetical protein
MADEHAQVVISGAGPNGLMLACELALAGIRPVVLDELPGPSLSRRPTALPDKWFGCWTCGACIGRSPATTIRPTPPTGGCSPPCR